VERQKLGGGVVLVAGALLAKETFGWAWSKFLDALAAGAGGPVTWQTFPYGNFLGVCLMAVGLWLLLKRDTAKLTKLQTLHESMKATYKRLDNCVEGSVLFVYPDIIGEVAAIFESLEKLRIVTPTVGASQGSKFYLIARTYVGAIMTLIRDGHVDMARREAPRVIADMGVEAAPLRSRWSL